MNPHKTDIRVVRKDITPCFRKTGHTRESVQSPLVVLKL